MQSPLALAKIGAVMFAAAFHTSRHYILFTSMACLCVLLGGPSYAAGADSLFIAGTTYYEPGVSGPGWAWTDADHLELTGHRRRRRPGGDADRAEHCCRDERARRGYLALRHGGVGRSDAPRHRVAGGHGLAVRDLRVGDARGWRLQG